MTNKIIKIAKTTEELIEAKIPIQDLMISVAFRNYINGFYEPWDLQEVVEIYGFKGWTCSKEDTLILHK